MNKKILNIGIDASKATKGFLSGTEYYTREIIKNIVSHTSENEKITLYSKDSIKNYFGDLPPNVKNKILRNPKRLWTQIRLSFESLAHPQDVLFIPAHTIPIFSRSPIVTTIHDLGFMRFPHLYPKHELWYHKLSMKLAIKKAAHIIAISKATKKDILKFYPYCLEKNITVIYHGYNKDRFRPLRPTDSCKFKNKYGPYILYIGRLEEKKNILGMVRAYALLRKERKIKHKLILAGRKKYGFEKVTRYIEQLPADIKRDIIFPGYVPDNDLPILLREADLFLFTTLFEGFGMPILEAFASGVPVVSSNLTSIPEVAGRAAILVDPRSPLDIASACSKIINKNYLRKKLVNAGLARSKFFSWEKAGKETLEVLKHAAQQKN